MAEKIEDTNIKKMKENSVPKNFRKRRESSSSENETTNEEEKTTESTETIKEKIEDLKYLQKQRERNHGLDVYSLAIGDASETAAKAAARKIDNDPWKSRTGGLVDMSEIREKRGNEIVRNMNSNFAKETNQRDEDAEMQKFIEQQLKMRHMGSSGASATMGEDGIGGGDADPSLADDATAVKKYKSPNDVIFDLPTYLLENKKKPEDGFTEQVLSGIPEVDLGIDERMRNIEETERAKAILLTKQTQQQLANQNRYKNDGSLVTAGTGFTSSVNFVQHKRFDETLINADKQRAQQMANAAAASKQARADMDEPVVGDAPKHELLQQAAVSASSSGGSHHHHHRPNTLKRKEAGSADAEHKPPRQHRPHTSGAPSAPTERASDDYCLERFKKNMKFSRSSKIKIA